MRLWNAGVVLAARFMSVAIFMGLRSQRGRACGQDYAEPVFLRYSVSLVLGKTVLDRWNLDEYAWMTPSPQPGVGNRFLSDG